jgi:FkbM family methyltransferase
MLIIDLLNSVLKKCGAKLIRFPEYDLSRRIKLLNHYEINKILDIGANDGGFAKEMFEIGYRGKIISFEPLLSAYSIIEAKSRNNNKWSTINKALGDFDGESFINVSKNSVSSSMLNMLPTHLNSAPASKYISKERIIVNKLDSIYDDFCLDNENVYLKIDTQGFEKQILDGALNSLKNIKGVQLELSIIPLYDVTVTYIEMITFLNELGFELYSIESGFSDMKTGQLLQIDAIFFRI